MCYNKHERFQSMNIDYLRNLCIARGIDFTGNREEIIERLVHSTVFAKTPLELAKYMASIRNKTDKRFGDLMAGNGNITMFIPGNDVLAVEKDKARYEAGMLLARNATWVNMDIFDINFIIQYIFETQPYDRVFCNPDFEFAFPAIYVGLLMIRNNPDGRLCFLLPSDFFESSPARARLYRVMNFSIEKEYKVGRWNYYPEKGKREKITCDSLFIIKYGGRDKKFAYPTYMARVQEGIQK